MRISSCSRTTSAAGRNLGDVSTEVERVKHSAIVQTKTQCYQAYWPSRRERKRAQGRRRLRVYESVMVFKVEDAYARRHVRSGGDRKPGRDRCKNGAARGRCTGYFNWCRAAVVDPLEEPKVDAFFPYGHARPGGDNRFLTLRGVATTAAPWTRAMDSAGCGCRCRHAAHTLRDA